MRHVEQIENLSLPLRLQCTVAQSNHLGAWLKKMPFKEADALIKKAIRNSSNVREKNIEEQNKCDEDRLIKRWANFTYDQSDEESASAESADESLVEP